MISGRFFFQTWFPGIFLPAGAVVVEARNGVPLERWMPVFMYASLSKQT